MNHARNKAALRSHGGLSSLIHTYRRPMEMRLPIDDPGMAAVHVVDAAGNRREIIGRAYQQLPATVNGGEYLLPELEVHYRAEGPLTSDEFAKRVSSAWPYKPGESPAKIQPYERLLSACGFKKVGA